MQVLSGGQLPEGTLLGLKNGWEVLPLHLFFACIRN